MDDRTKEICKKIEAIWKENQMLKTLLDLNMNDFWDVVDQRDWYYEQYQKLKRNLSDEVCDDVPGPFQIQDQKD
jgi:hypothetical protein